jgi:hypothetical protein
VSAEPDRLCRAEMRVEAPNGTWTARFASAIHDAPQAVLWDVPGLLVVKYGFRLYGLDARTGTLRWNYASRSPILAVLGSSRLPHVVCQTEIETLGVRDDGGVTWRAAHSDVIVGAELVGGHLVLTTYGGPLVSLDPLTGRRTD